MNETKLIGKETRKRKRKLRYKFSNKRHPIKGIVSLIIAVISFISIIIISYVSSLSYGNGDIILGAIGVVSMLFCIVGFILSINAMKQKEIYYVIPIIGLLMNGILFTVYFVLYIIGI